MAATAVSVAPPIVRREQLVQRTKQVLLRPAAGLQDGDARGGMRDEDVHQPVSAGLAREVGRVSCDVDDALAITGTKLERRCLHDPEA